MQHQIKVSNSDPVAQTISKVSLLACFVLMVHLCEECLVLISVNACFVLLFKYFYNISKTNIQVGKFLCTVKIHKTH